MTQIWTSLDFPKWNTPLSHPIRARNFTSCRTGDENKPMFRQAGPKREQRVSLPLLNSFSKSPEMSCSSLWNVKKGVGETKTVATAKRAAPTLLAKPRRRGEGEHGYLLSHYPCSEWSDRGPRTVIVQYVPDYDGSCSRALLLGPEDLDLSVCCWPATASYLLSEPWFLHL